MPSPEVGKWRAALTLVKLQSDRKESVDERALRESLYKEATRSLKAGRAGSSIAGCGNAVFNNGDWRKSCLACGLPQAKSRCSKCKQVSHTCDSLLLLDQPRGEQQDDEFKGMCFNPCFALRAYRQPSSIDGGMDHSLEHIEHMLATMAMRCWLKKQANAFSFRWHIAARTVRSGTGRAIDFTVIL